jgi:hypothetical protein
VLLFAVVVDQAKRLAKSVLDNPRKSLNVRVTQNLLVPGGERQQWPE